jgi:hypothetical protein
MQLEKKKDQMCECKKKRRIAGKFGENMAWVTYHPQIFAHNVIPFFPSIINAIGVSIGQWLGQNLPAKRSRICVA